MNYDWLTVTASDFCSKVTDGTHATPKPCHRGKPLITSKHIKDANIDFDSAYKISIEDFNEINRRSKVDQWDVIISMIGAYCGYCFVERGENPDYAVKNVGLFKAGSKEHAEWLYYFLKSPLGKARLYQARGGSSQPYLPLGGLRELEISCPKDPIILRRIVTVLSNIDAKIEINRRINSELGALAKTIYDYWFVQFDFPDENGRPYKSSGGAMEWNVKLGRVIPRGWRAHDISSVAHVLGGGTPSKKNADYWGGEIPFFTPSDAGNEVFRMVTEDSITPLGSNKCSSKAFPKGTIFITARGSVGKVVIAGRDMAMNQSCYALQPRDLENFPFVYEHAKTLVNHLRVKSTGSIFKSIISNDIELAELVDPPDHLVEQFSERLRPAFDRIAAGIAENQKLAELRDWLLPMLMNGQVRVG